MFVCKWNAGNQQNLLKPGRDGHTSGVDGLVRVRTPARQEKKTGRRDMTGSRLYASMTVRKQGVTVRVEKIGGAQLAQIGSELGYDRKALFNRRQRGCRVPETTNALKQRAEGVFGIRRAERMVTVESKIPGSLDTG